MPAPTSHLANVTKFLRRLPVEAQALGTLINSGLVGFERPDRLRAMHRAVDRYGAMGALLTVAGVRHGDRTGLVDEFGSLTYAEMDRRSNVVGNALRAGGLGPGDGVGILCRNHRGMFDASYGVLKTGARVLYLNTDFAGPQAAEVCRREGVQAVIYDEEFAEVVAGIDAPKGRFVAWSDGQASRRDRRPGLLSLIDAGDDAPPPGTKAPGSVVILTSGTTGLPKGATRSQPRSLTAAAAILSRIPFRARESTFIAPPLYHAWGLGMSVLAIGLGSTWSSGAVSMPRPRWRRLAEHRCTALAVVPVLLNRLLVARRGSHRGVRSVAACASSRPAAPSWRRPSPPGPWTSSATLSTTCTARPRWPGRRSPPRQICAPPRARPADRRSEPPCGSSTTTADRVRTARPGGSSLAAAWSSPVTPEVAARKSLMGSCPPATSGISIPRGGSGSMGARTK